MNTCIDKWGPSLESYVGIATFNDWLIYWPLEIPRWAAQMRRLDHQLTQFNGGQGTLQDQLRNVIDRPETSQNLDFCVSSNVKFWFSNFNTFRQLASSRVMYFIDGDVVIVPKGTTNHPQVRPWSWLLYHHKLICLSQEQQTSCVWIRS